MNMTKAILTFISGTVLGAIGGLLFAPKSGKESRKEIKNKVEEAASSLEQGAAERLEEAKEILNKNVRTQASNAKAAIDKVSEKIQA